MGPKGSIIEVYIKCMSMLHMRCKRHASLAMFWEMSCRAFKVLAASACAAAASSRHLHQGILNPLPCMVLCQPHTK